MPLLRFARLRLQFQKNLKARLIRAERNPEGVIVPRHEAEESVRNQEAGRHDHAYPDWGGQLS